MKPTKYFPLLLVALLLAIGAISLGVYTPNDQPTDSTQDAATEVRILNFHATHRCATCLKIEKLAKASLSELKSAGYKAGYFKYSLLDVTKEKKLAKQYEAFGTALVVHALKNGKTVYKKDFTQDAFMMASDAGKFKSKFKGHLKTAYKKLK